MDINIDKVPYLKKIGVAYMELKDFNNAVLFLGKIPNEMIKEDPFILKLFEKALNKIDK